MPFSFSSTSGNPLTDSSTLTRTWQDKNHRLVDQMTGLAMTAHPLITRIKSTLKKSSTLVKLVNRITGFIKNNRTHPCFTQDTYFQNLFAKNPSLNSLSFHKGLITGKFRDANYYLKLNPKNLIESCVYTNGIWEEHIVNLIANYIGRGKGSVIDIGANIGATSIPLAVYSPETRFYLFEPHPEVFQDLCNNVSYNQLENIKVFNQAVTNAPDKSRPFYAQKNAKNFGQSSFKKNHDINEHEVIDVDCISIDSIFENSDEPVKVIKIDTQGSELHALLSARQTIRKNRPVIIFEFENEYFDSAEEEKATKQQLLNFFHDESYDLYLLTPGQSFFPEVTLSSYFNGDVLALPKAVTAEHRSALASHNSCA